MSIEQNKAVARRFFEDAWFDPQVCDEIFAPLIHFHAIQHADVAADLDSNPLVEKAFYQWLKTVWEEGCMTVDEMIAEGDRVMARYTFRGTQRGEYLGLPPTGREVVYSGIYIFRFEDGRICEVWDIFDRLWLWQQLGVFPNTEASIDWARSAMQNEPDQAGHAGGDE